MIETILVSTLRAHSLRSDVPIGGPADRSNPSTAYGCKGSHQTPLWQIAKRPHVAGVSLSGGERGIVRNHPRFRPGGRLRRPNSLPTNLSNPAALWAARVLNHLASARQKICPTAGAYLLRGGERGIRTLDGLLTHTPLAGARLQPLGHLSGTGHFILLGKDREP